MNGQKSSREELLTALQDAVSAMDDAGLDLLVRSARTLIRTKPVQKHGLTQLDLKPKATS